jgi:ubiquinone biosynthesis protein
MRGQPVKDMSIGMMLDGLFGITRDFDMVTQPHLLLLQKTMVMVEGVATGLDPDINLWETAAPFVREWIRSELGPEAKVADRLIQDVRTLAGLPDLVRRIEAKFPPPGGEPPAPPLARVEVLNLGGGWKYAAAGAFGVALGAIGALAVTAL